LSRPLYILILAFLLLAWAGSSAPARAYQEPTPTLRPLTPAEIIARINRIRTGRGLRALIVDPILMGTAQSTADVMAGFSMTGHIGDVRGRVIAAGYGAGDIAWATENFAVLPVGTDPGVIFEIWSDDLHMKPMADPNYRHIGAGVALASEEAVYFIVHAAYTSNGTYKPNLTPPAPGADGASAGAFSISQYVFAVQTATPRPDGSLVHIVRQGQSLWSIAIAYQTHIDTLQRLNHLSQDNLTIYIGQKLLIPTAEKAMPIKQVAAETATAASVQSKAQTGTGVARPATTTPSPVNSPPASEAYHPAATTPTSPPSIPLTGDSLNQAILTALVVLGIVGVASIVFGVVVKK
jgi:LysM repeat protein